MTYDFLQSIVTGLITGIFSAGAVWGVLKTEMRFMRRDVDRAHRRLDAINAPGQHGAHCPPL